MDIQLILDAGKVAEYMTKYVTKPESDMPISFRNMIRYIMQNQLANGNNVQSTMRIAMSKLFGERMLSRQETSHLIFSLHERPILSEIGESPLHMLQVVLDSLSACQKSKL